MKKNHKKKPSASKLGKKIPKAGSKVAQNGAAATKPTLPAAQMAAISEITRLHGEIRESIRLTAVKAVELGGRLTELKKEVGRGRWLLFVKENLPFCARTAERYMGLHENRAELKKFDTMSDFKVTDAYRFLRGGKRTTADQEENAEDGAVHAQADKGAIITALTRSLCVGLERLGTDKLKQFESDLLEFKLSWLEQHAGEVEK